MSRILGLLLLIQVAAIIFHNKEDIDKGFCHLQKVKIQVLLDCRLSYASAVTIALAKNESDTSGNYILQCVWINGKSMNCSGDSDETGYYNGFTDILEIKFMFNDNKHAGLYLRITTNCNSGSIALTPCRFTANVDFYNNSAIKVTCQNPTFVKSSSPMIIQAYHGDQYGSCLPQMCVDSTCKNLPDGIQCMLPYNPDEMLQCRLYGAVINITTPSSENTTTISPGNSSTPKNTEATESLESSSTSQSITATSAESSTSKKDKTTPLTSSERTESEKTIFTTTKGSTDMTTSQTNVQQSKLSSKSPDWVKPVMIGLGSILPVGLTIAFVICGCMRFRNGSGQNDKKMP